MLYWSSNLSILWFFGLFVLNFYFILKIYLGMLQSVICSIELGIKGKQNEVYAVLQISVFSHRV